MFIKAVIVQERGNNVIKRMPRMATIPGISIEAYRALQRGEAVDVSEETADHLIKSNYAEPVQIKREKKEKEG